MAGIYIHIPFCHSKCVYCGFYSKPLSLFKSKEHYISALEKEIEVRSDKGELINSIYFGGGTPSTLTLNELERTFNSLHNNFLISSEAEITIEVNPDDIEKDYVRGLKDLGINRVSIGVQSFIDSHLKWMGRRYTSSQILDSFKILFDEGIENISADIIFGFSSLTNEELEYNLNTLISLSPKHISTYQLSLDDGSILEKLSNRGENFLLPDEVCYEQYSLIQSILESADYSQYEISNFSKSGFHSRHNTNYWNRTPYFGFGAGAHSFLNGRRCWNKNDIKGYIDYYLYNKCEVANKEDNIAECEILSSKDVINEYIFLGLRTVEGLDWNELKRVSDEFIKLQLQGERGGKGPERKNDEERDAKGEMKGERRMNEREKDDMKWSEEKWSDVCKKIECALERKNLISKEIGDKKLIAIPKEKLFISDSIISDLFVV